MYLFNNINAKKYLKTSDNIRNDEIDQEFESECETCQVRKHKIFPDYAPVEDDSQVSEEKLENGESPKPSKKKLEDLIMSKIRKDIIGKLCKYCKEAGCKSS